MSSSKSFAAKQKKAKEFTHESSYAPVHEPKAMTATGSQSFSPPPLQLQASAPSSIPDQSPPIMETASAAPEAVGGGAPQPMPVAAETVTAGPDDGLRGGSPAGPEQGEAEVSDGLAPVPSEHGGGENVNAEDGLPAVEGAHAGNGNVNPEDGLPVVESSGPDDGLRGDPGADPHEQEAETAPRFPACEVDGAVNDWTTEERANLDMGADLVGDLQSRLSPECADEMEAYGQSLMAEALEEPICRVIPQHGRNLERTECTEQVDFTDIHGMIEQIGQDVPTDVQRVAAYNAVAQEVIDNSSVGNLETIVNPHSIVNPRDMRPELLDPVEETSWKHAIHPFTDGHHGYMGGIDGDAVSPFAPNMDTMTFLDQDNEAEMDWFNSLPSQDSMAGEGQLSEGYSYILGAEGTPEDAGAWTSFKRWMAGTLPDARTSLAAIENYRDFRSDGWGAFADGFHNRFITPPGGE